MKSRQQLGHIGYENRPQELVKSVRFDAYDDTDIGKLRKKFADSRARLYQRLSATPENDCGCG